MPVCNMRNTVTMLRMLQMLRGPYARQAVTSVTTPYRVLQCYGDGQGSFQDRIEIRFLTRAHFGYSQRVR